VDPKFLDRQFHAVFSTAPTGPLQASLQRLPTPLS
jgi:hypothetical protein